MCARTPTVENRFDNDTYYSALRVTCENKRFWIPSGARGGRVGSCGFTTMLLIIFYLSATRHRPVYNTRTAVTGSGFCPVGTFNETRSKRYEIKHDFVEL